MSRARNLKPGFFKNDVLAELPFEYRILFQGLWCESDREGRLADRPKRIKAEVFPYDDVDVEAGLRALESKGFIARYESGGEKYIQVLAFLKHQNPHCKEAASTIPAPCENSSITVEAEKIPERAGLIPDSLNLIPDSISPPADAGALRFGEFWGAYPNKTGRKPCLAKWKARRLDNVADAIVADVKAKAIGDRRWLDGFVPNPETYLNQDRWKDPVQPRANGSPPQPDIPDFMVGAI